MAAKVKLRITLTESVKSDQASNPASCRKPLTPENQARAIQAALSSFKGVSVIPDFRPDFNEFVIVADGLLVATEVINLVKGGELLSRLNVNFSEQPITGVKLLDYALDQAPLASTGVKELCKDAMEEEKQSSCGKPSSTLSGGEKAKVYYDVIDQLSGDDWNEFVRKKLDLRERDIEEIKADNSSHVREQKYKMLLRWEIRTDQKPECLATLVQEYKQELTQRTQTQNAIYDKSNDGETPHRWSFSGAEVVYRHANSSPNTPHHSVYRVSETFSEPPNVRAYAERRGSRRYSRFSPSPSIESFNMLADGFDRDTPSFKVGLEDVVFVKDERDLEKEGNYQEALHVLNKKLRNERHHGKISMLIDAFRIAAKAGDLEKARCLTKETTDHIRNNVETSYAEIKAFADKLRSVKSDLKALLFYLIATECYAGEQSTALTPDSLENCARAVKETATSMLATDSKSADIALNLVVPALQEIRAKVSSLPVVDTANQCINESRCLLHASDVALASGKAETGKPLLFDAMTCLKKGLGKDAELYSVYGQCLHAMGRTFAETQDVATARQYFLMALDAARKADDYKSSQIRTDEVKRIQENMKRYGLQP